MSGSYVKGGSFLITDSADGEIFTPEKFSSDQLMYAKTASDFAHNEVLPLSDRIDAKEEGLVPELLRKAGELGLLMADIPETYGGLGLDKSSSTLISESMAVQGSFSVVVGGHAGIGTLPIVYYGTDAAKEKYLPKLACAELIGCYCLTEPSSGSDALAAKTKAVLSEDGSHYVLNGVKQFITNGAIADIFVVFAKVDGEHFTGFVVEKGYDGLSIGPEEHKMGITGSSTTSVILEDVKVPVENLLGEIGKGHKIAFNILNIGRFKLGAGCVGGGKEAIKHALAYSMERKQFGKRISDFGLIREKLARMVTILYALEASVYRTVGMIDGLLESGEFGEGEGSLQAIEEYSIECAIAKVAGSEGLDFIADDAVQIYGGYGYCAEYPVERFYRDSRINRIFEGTNEINRLLIPGMLLRKALKGDLPFLEAAKKLQDELMDIPNLDLDEESGPLDPQRKIVANLKKMCLFVAGYAAQKYGRELEQRQEILARVADLAILAYLADSAVLRAGQDRELRGEKSWMTIACAENYCEEAIAKAETIARETVRAMEEGDTLLTLTAALRRLSRRTIADTVGNREKIATAMIDAERLVW